MAGKERPRGPHVAAYEYVKHEPGEHDRRFDIREGLTSKLSIRLSSTLQMWGIPDERMPNIVTTPEIYLCNMRLPNGRTY